MKRKLLSITLALALCMSLAVPAFADGFALLNNDDESVAAADAEPQNVETVKENGITYRIYTFNAGTTITSTLVRTESDKYITDYYVELITNPVLEGWEWDGDSYENLMLAGDTKTFTTPGLFAWVVWVDLYNPDTGDGASGGRVHFLLNIISDGSPDTPAPEPQTVNPTASTVYLNGEAKAFEAYNIAGYNYFKLRDLAFVLDGTEKQFEVGYDNNTRTIKLTSGDPYTAVGGEMVQGDGTSKNAAPTPSTIYLDGEVLDLVVYNIGGNNFFKLRDLMEAVDVYVGYDNATRAITLDTSRGYVPE